MGVSFRGFRKAVFGSVDSFVPTLHRRPSRFVDADPPGLRAINFLEDITASPRLLPPEWRPVLDLPTTTDPHQRATVAALRLLLERARPLAGPRSERLRSAARELLRLFLRGTSRRTGLALVHEMASAWLAGADPAHDLGALRDRLLREGKLIWSELSDRQQAICAAIWSTAEPMDRDWIATHAALRDDSNLRDDLTELKRIGILAMVGRGPASRWRQAFKPLGSGNALDYSKDLDG